MTLLFTKQTTMAVHHHHLTRVLLYHAALLAEGAIDEAMAEVLDEEYPANGMNGAGAGFVV